MAKIIRYNGNLVPFASASLGTERTVFGDVTQADDITSQYTADFLRGWGIVGPSDQPTLQDFNAVSYTHGQILAYLHQVGVPEYNAAQEYHIGSFANVSGVLYVSITNSNTGNAPATSPSQWTSLSRYGLNRFTVNGSFTVPAGVTTIYVSGCAGGGGGGGSIGVGASTVVSGAGGGAAGEFRVREAFSVTPGQVLAVTVGAGGAAGAVGGDGGNGGATVLGALLTLAGGTGGLTSATAASSSVAAGPPGGTGIGGEGGTGCDSNSSGGGFGGMGANGPYGNGGALVRGVVGGVTIPGKTARGFGGGGGGAGGVYGGATGGTGSAGGAAGGGLLIIEC